MSSAALISGPWRVHRRCDVASVPSGNAQHWQQPTVDVQVGLYQCVDTPCAFHAWIHARDYKANEWQRKDDALSTVDELQLLLQIVLLAHRLVGMGCGRIRQATRISGLWWCHASREMRPWCIMTEIKPNTHRSVQAPTTTRV